MDLAVAIKTLWETERMIKDARADLAFAVTTNDKTVALEAVKDLSNASEILAEAIAQVRQATK